MICVFFLFCSLVIDGNVPLYDGAVSRYENALLAHNYQDGRYFSEIETGDMLRYFDGAWTDYTVTEIVKAQAVAPMSLTTPLLVGGQSYTPPFGDENKLILQTCIYKDGDLNWGRLFVIAERYGQ